MVWGKLPGYDWWPGNIISYEEESRRGSVSSVVGVGREERELRHGGEERVGAGEELGGEGKGGGSEGEVWKGGKMDVTLVWIKWFGENNLSQVCMCAGACVH